MGMQLWICSPFTHRVMQHLHAMISPEVDPAFRPRKVHHFICICMVISFTFELSLLESLYLDAVSYHLGDKQQCTYLH